MSDLNVVLNTMSELVAMCMATSSVRDSGDKRRKGDHQDLSHVSHVMTLVHGVFIDLPRRGSFLRSARKGVPRENVMLCTRKSGWALSKRPVRSVVGMEWRSRTARSVFNCVLKRFHGQLQKECV